MEIEARIFHDADSDEDPLLRVNIAVSIEHCACALFTESKDHAKFYSGIH